GFGGTFLDSGAPFWIRGHFFGFAERNTESGAHINRCGQSKSKGLHASQIGQNSDLTFCGSNCMWVSAWTPNYYPLVWLNYYPLVWLNVDTIQQGSYPGADLWLTGTGTVSMTGFEPTPGHFYMGMVTGDFGQYEAWTNFAFFADDP